MVFEKTYTEAWTDYELIDAGGGKKMERFGQIITIRPELQAYFKSGMPFSEWTKMAHATFEEVNGRKGKWRFHKENIPAAWNIEVLGLKLKLEFTQFKHVGIFPEQYINWNLLRNRLRLDDKFLNLFAYTGVASLVGRSVGAEVTHVDSVKQLVSWSKENMELSQLENIRWMVDDALKFAQKEVKRGNQYKGIIMDPPAFGLGSKGEKWILEQRLPELLEAANLLLGKDGFLIVNTYSLKITTEDLYRLSQRILPERKSEITELWGKTKTNKELYFGNILKVFG